MTHFIHPTTFVTLFQTGSNVNAQNITGVTVKKEPEESPSTSQHLHTQQQQTIAVTVAPNQLQQQHTLIDASSLTAANGNQPQHIVTQHENTDGTTSLSIAQVQPLSAGHQLTLSNLNQVRLKSNNKFQLISIQLNEQIIFNTSPCFTAKKSTQHLGEESVYIERE